MPNEVKFEFTITKEAVEAFAALLSTFFSPKEEREGKYAKEEKEENPITKTIDPITKNNPITLDHSNTNNNKTTIIVDGCMNGGGNRENREDNRDKGSTVTEGDTICGFNPPSLQEIKSFCDDNHYNIDPYRYYTYYTARKWCKKNGDLILPDWKGHLVSWLSNGNNKPTQPISPNKVGLGTAEERRKAHPFVPTDFEALSIRNRGNSSDEEESYDSCAG